MNKKMWKLVIPSSVVSIVAPSLLVSCGVTTFEFDDFVVTAESLKSYIDTYGVDDGTGKKVIKPIDINNIADINSIGYDLDHSIDWSLFNQSWRSRESWMKGVPLFSLGQASSIFLNVAKRWGFKPTYSTNIPVFKIDTDNDGVFETVDQDRTDKLQALYNDLKGYDQVKPEFKDILQKNWLLDMGEDGAMDYRSATKMGVHFGKSWLTDNNEYLTRIPEQFSPNNKDLVETSVRVAWSGVNWDPNTPKNSAAWLSGGHYEKLNFGEAKEANAMEFNVPAIVNYSSYLDIDNPGSIKVKAKFKMNFKPKMAQGQQAYELYDKITDKPMRDAIIDRENSSYWDKSSSYFLDKVLTIPDVAPKYPIIHDTLEIERYSSLLMAMVDQARVLYNSDKTLQNDFHPGVIGGMDLGGMFMNMPSVIDSNFLTALKFISNKISEFDGIDTLSGDLDEEGNLNRTTFKKAIAEIFNEFNKSQVFSWRALDTFFSGVTLDLPKIFSTDEPASINLYGMRVKFGGSSIVDSSTGKRFTLKGFNSTKIFSDVQSWCKLDYNSDGAAIKY